MCPFQFCNHLDGEKRAGCFSLFVFLMSHDCCVRLPHDATGLSAVYDCGNILIILTTVSYILRHIFFHSCETHPMNVQNKSMPRKKMHT